MLSTKWFRLSQKFEVGGLIVGGYSRVCNHVFLKNQKNKTVAKITVKQKNPPVHVHVCISTNN